MKKFFGLAQTGVLALGLAVVPMAAQSVDGDSRGMGSSSADTTMTHPGTTTTPVDTRDHDDDGFNWGWLGLAGLAGLAGLRRHNHRHHDHVVRNDDIGRTDRL